jgi:hypothetical protein
MIWRRHARGSRSGTMLTGDVAGARNQQEQRAVVYSTKKTGSIAGFLRRFE